MAHVAKNLPKIRLRTWLLCSTPSQVYLADRVQLDVLGVQVNADRRAEVDAVRRPPIAVQLDVLPIASSMRYLGAQVDSSRTSRPLGAQGRSQAVDAHR